MSYSEDEDETIVRSPVSSRDDDIDYGMEEGKYNHGADPVAGIMAMGEAAVAGDTIIDDLRGHGLNVLCIRRISDLLTYTDAVARESIEGEACLVYIDIAGRVFNVVVSGGAQGISAAYGATKGAFSGVAATVALPFVARMVAGASDVTFSPSYQATDVPSLGLHPGLLFCVFAVLLANETADTWLSVAMNVRACNSVGAHVWRTRMMTDYPRLLVLLCLSLAWFAPIGSSAQDFLTALGAGLGGALLLVNLGCGVWKKLGIDPFDRDAFYAGAVSYFLALVAGIALPYLGLRSVNGGCDESSDDYAYPDGGARRARQMVTGASVLSGTVFAVTDTQWVQELLGFSWRYQGAVNIAVGLWWFLTTAASLAVCSRLEPGQGEVSQPFLIRDEASPVGWVVPSLPKILVHPAHRGKPYGCCGYVSDVIGSAAIVGVGTVIIWAGVRQIGGNEEPWNFLNRY